jgi:hypothetical protein
VRGLLAKKPEELKRKWMLLSGNTATKSDHLIDATFQRGDIVINLSLDPDSITAKELRALDSINILSRVIRTWDVDDSPPVPEFLNILPIGFLNDLSEFVSAEIFPAKDALMNLRRYLMTGGVIGKAPDYFWDIRDARVLGVPVTEIHTVPMHWRMKARVVDAAEKQARRSIANKNKAMLAYIPEI